MVQIGRTQRIIMVKSGSIPQETALFLGSSLEDRENRWQNYHFCTKHVLSHVTLSTHDCAIPFPLLSTCILPQSLEFSFLGSILFVYYNKTLLVGNGGNGKDIPNALY